MISIRFEEWPGYARGLFFTQSFTYQRKNRGPSNAPISVASVMPSRYQTAQNATLISGQWKQ